MPVFKQMKLRKPGSQMPVFKQMKLRKPGSQMPVSVNQIMVNKLPYDSIT